MKPANILVTPEGQVKLLDFGISRYQGDSNANATLTQEGMIIGTVYYMSPEQALGGPIDERSDIFSFGSVLYEMLSGRKAFNGDSPMAVIQSILNDECQPLPGHPALERIIMRCLEKGPASRFQTASELKAALTHIHSADQPARPSIVVLPFQDMSGDKDHEYFGDGLAEEIINSLARIPAVKVIARTSAFAFKGKHEDIRGIAGTLGVDHALEGSVRRAGNRIRITAQLITARDGSNLWSQRFDREWAYVFAIQDEISQAIVEALRLKLSANSGSQLKHTPKLASYEALLRARHDSLDYRPEAADRCRRNSE